MFWNNKKLSHSDLVEFQARVRMAAQERFKYNCIKGNTYRIPKGQILAEQQLAVLEVIDESLKDWIGQLLSKYNCQKGIQYNIDGENGVITVVGSTNENIPEEIREQYKKELAKQK